MTVASPLVFPGSRVIAGWWRQLAPRQPRSLWIGHLLFHRVEALAQVAQPIVLDSFSRLVLQALQVVPRPTVQELDSQLHLGVALLGQVLRRLQGEGLAEVDGAGGWDATPLARQALADGSYARPHYERRVFHFLHRPKARDETPPFLHLDQQAAPSGSIPEGWAFDMTWLQACPRQPVTWRQERGFPLEVQDIVGIPEGGLPAEVVGSLPAWQRIVLDRPEQLIAAMVLLPADGGSDLFAGFAVRPEGWVLHAAEPAFKMTSSWLELFPELAEEVPSEAWREAWRQWCQPRGVPLAEAETCTLRRRACWLDVQAPKRLLDRLRNARSDALKGEAWLLAGSGPVRAAALVELSESA